MDSSLSSWNVCVVFLYSPHGGTCGLDNIIGHDDVIKWKLFPRYWLFVLGIHRSPVNSPHKSQWRGALMFSLICVWINGWVNNREAGDLRRYRAPLWRHCNDGSYKSMLQCFVPACEAVQMYRTLKALWGVSLHVASSANEFLWHLRFVLYNFMMWRRNLISKTNYTIGLLLRANLEQIYNRMNRHLRNSPNVVLSAPPHPRQF